MIAEMMPLAPLALRTGPPILGWDMNVRNGVIPYSAPSVSSYCIPLSVMLDSSAAVLNDTRPYLNDEEYEVLAHLIFAPVITSWVSRSLDDALLRALAPKKDVRRNCSF